MKFSARYEILRALTRGDVETFEIRDRATGEKALAHIFECAEPPSDQPTVQWILTSFRRLAPESPGEPIDAGRCDIASFAYIVTRWPTDQAVDSWVRDYHNQVSATPKLDSSDSASGPDSENQPSADEHPSSQPAAVTDPFSPGSRAGSAESPSSEFTRQFFGGVHFARQTGSGEKEANPAEDPTSARPRAIASDNDDLRLVSMESTSEVSSASLSEAPGQRPGGPGAFTRQFFREINVSPDGTLGSSTGVSAFREHCGPDDESPGQTGSTPAPWDEPPLSSDTAFDINGQPAEADPPAGQFTQLFMQDSGSPRFPSQPHEPASQEPAKSASGEFTQTFRMHSAGDSTSGITPDFTSEPTNTTAEFNRMFGHSVRDAPEELHPRSGLGEPDVMPARGSSTEILNGSPVSERRSREDFYTSDASSSFAKVDDGATQVFAPRADYSEGYDKAPSQAPVRDPIPSMEHGVPDFSRFEAAGDGSATVVFHGAAEIAAGVPDDGPANGPSEYTMFMKRDDRLAAVAGSPDSPAGAPQGSQAGAAGAAFNTPPLAGPVIPSYQPPAPPAYPPAPAMPGLAPPAVPAVAAPVNPVPLAVRGGQPTPPPKSYLPLIIILNVLFVLAILLILYFAVKH